ncbi:MAG TPA: PQQ-dependent sugar dehydrogenase [Vicinamibacterales bacterium]|nr:PQQ-dependent sugar dehydrogenase [Vicinamibacterales bacterium]
MHRSKIASRAAVVLLLSTSAVSAARQNPRIVPTPQPIVGELPASPPEQYLPQPPGVSVETWQSGLEAIWSLQFAPDGRLFLTEKFGRVRVVSRTGQLHPAPWIAIDVMNEGGEGGLMGLALDPRFPREPWVYLMYTGYKQGRPVNRVVRFRETDGRGQSEQVLLDDLPGALNHNGGRLAFGPDGMLYVSAGDAYHPMSAQDLSSPAGAILRLTPEGRVPPDNPWPGNPIWAQGLRNPNGLAFRPRTGTLFAGDHGPTSEWGPPPIRDRDELNLIEKGVNYGWPLVVGAARQPGLRDPLLSWIPSTPPGALVFYDASLLPQLKGDLLYSSLAGQALLRIRFQDAANPNRITAIERWFNTGPRGASVYGRLRGMTVGPDGAVYVGTSNRDGRGAPRAGDDRILRIRPGT